MKRALADMRLPPDENDDVNAHATDLAGAIGKTVTTPTSNLQHIRRL